MSDMCHWLNGCQPGWESELGEWQLALSTSGPSRAGHKKIKNCGVNTHSSQPYKSLNHGFALFQAVCFKYHYQ